jgi:CheY-like chemotaxis protein
MDELTEVVGSSGADRATSTWHAYGFTDPLPRCELVWTVDGRVQNRHMCDHPERRRTARPQRVLIVDDSDDIREMWRLWLTYWGFAVEEAGNGAEAVEKVRTHPPDLVLMDLWMPVLDGLRATELLKADTITAEVPVLALSAQGGPYAEEWARAAGAEAFLHKPADPDELLVRMREVFSRAQKTRRT